MPRGDRISKADQAWAIENSLSTDVRYCRNKYHIKLTDLPAAYETAPSELILERYGVKGENGLELPDGNRQPRGTFLKFADRRASAAGASGYKCTERIHHLGTAKSGTANPQDATSFHPGQWDICDCHIPPDVYYQAFRKAEDNVTKNWDMPSIICKDDGTEIRLPIEDRPKYDENGEPMRDINGNYVIECIKDLSGKMIEHPLYDFEILPLQISRAESPWMFEMWMRVDPRIQWSDISIRMIHGDGGRRPCRNTMNMSCVRLRNRSGLKDWGRNRLLPTGRIASSAAPSTISVNLPPLESGWNPFGAVKRTFKKPSSKLEAETESLAADERETEPTVSISRSARKRKIQLGTPTRKRRKLDETDSGSLTQTGQRPDLLTPDYTPSIAPDLSGSPKQVDIDSFYHTIQTQYEAPGQYAVPSSYLITLPSYELQQFLQDMQDLKQLYSPDLQQQHALTLEHFLQQVQESEQHPDPLEQYLQEVHVFQRQHSPTPDLEQLLQQEHERLVQYSLDDE